MTTGTTITLSMATFVTKVMSLLFDTLSRWYSFFSHEQVSFNFMTAVSVLSDFGTQENKVHHGSHYFPLYFP